MRPSSYTKDSAGAFLISISYRQRNGISAELDSPIIMGFGLHSRQLRVGLQISLLLDQHRLSDYVQGSQLIPGTGHFRTHRIRQLSLAFFLMHTMTPPLTQFKTNLTARINFFGLSKFPPELARVLLQAKISPSLWIYIK